jgi:chemotaxis response regulator CheB
MHTIRVLLVNMPRLLREIVREVIATEPDLQVVDELTGGYLELAAVLDSVVADVVILGTESRESGDLLLPLLQIRPALRFVIIAEDGRAGFVCTPSGELSPARLLEAVRGHTGRP